MFVELVAWGVATIAAVLLGLVARGLLPMCLRDDGSPVFHLSAGVVLILSAAAIRALYWDALPMVLDLIHPGLWSIWNHAIGRPVPNILNGLVFILGARHLLVMQLMLIPEHERAQYSIWTAPFYPQRVCLVRGIAAMRRAWANRGIRK